MMSTTAEVIFTPPPVEPGAAPMNIRTVRPAWRRRSCRDCLKNQSRAVRVVTDWKKAFKSFCQKGMEPMDFRIIPFQKKEKKGAAG